MMYSSGNLVTSIVSQLKYEYFRDSEGFQGWYEAISVIEYNGRLNSSGESDGHYTCDIKENITNMWFKTNDSTDPFQIRVSDVSKHGYVVLYKRA